MTQAEAIMAKAKADVEALMAQAKAELPKAEAEITQALKTPWERYVLYGGVLLLLAYILWSFFHKPPASTTQFTASPPAISSPKVSVPGPKKIKIVPKETVQKKFPQESIKPTEQVINTGKIPDAPYGGVTIDKIDTDPETGEAVASEDFKPNSAPWFSFEDKNYIGAGYAVSNQGSYVPVYLKRDILQIKEVHLQVEVGGRVPMDATAKGEAHVGANLEYRFNGLNPFK